MSTTEPEVSPPVHEVLQLAEAAADINRLLALDASWTGAETRSAEITAQDRETLIALGDRIEAELAAIEPHVATIRRIFAAHPSWVNARLAEALASNEVAAARQEDIRRVLEVEGDDFAGRGVALADTLVERIPREREELQQKVRTLRENGPIITDMSHETACTLGALGGMGGLTACVVLDQPVLCVGGGVLLLTVIVVC